MRFITTAPTVVQRWMVMGMDKLGLYYGKSVKVVTMKDEDDNKVEYVPVVRCNDCQFYMKRGGNNFWCDIFDKITSENDFCSYGERRNNE